MTIENDIRIDQTSQVAPKIENHDWAQLAFYKDENKKISRIEEKNKRVVFVGDSITEGWGNLFPTFFQIHVSLIGVLVGRPLHRCWSVLGLTPLTLNPT